MPSIIYKGNDLYSCFLNSNGVDMAIYKENVIAFNPLANGQTYKNIPTLDLSVSSLQISGAENSKTFTFSYDGDGSISVESSDRSVATTSVSGSTVTVTYVGPGSSTINISATEGMLYEAINSSILVQCTKSTPTLETSVSNLTIYGADGTGTFTCDYDGDAILTAASSNSTVASVDNIVSSSNVIITYITAGSVTITISAVETARYYAASTTVSVSCLRTASTLTLSHPSLSITGASGSAAFTFDYTSDGAITVSSTNTSVATVSRNGKTVTVTYVGAGSATVTVSIANGTKYAATSASCSISCSKSNPTYTAPTAKSLTYTRTNASTATAQALLNAGSITSGHGTLQYSSNNSSWSTTIPTGTNAGTYTVYWRIVGNSKYNDKASASIKVTIAKRTLAVPGLTGTTSFTNNNATTRSVSSNGNYNSVYMYTGGTWSASNPGTYTVTWNLRDTTNCVWSGNTTAAKSATWTISSGSVTFYVWYTNGEAAFTTTYAAWSSIGDLTRTNTSSIIAVQYHYYSGSYGAVVRYAGNSGYIGVRVNTAGHWGPQNGVHYSNLNGNVVEHF